MKIKIYDNESKIYDLLQFPRAFIATHKGGYIEKNDMTELRKLNSQEYLEMFDRIGKKLKPYDKEISKFYGQEFFCIYDFFMLLTDQYSFFGYETIDDYLNYLMTLSNDSLKESLVFALVSIDKDEDEPKSEIEKEVKRLIDTPTELMKFVKDLPTISEYKFNLLMMLENPQKILKEFYVFIKQIEPIYEEFYQENLKRIEECKSRLTEVFADGTLDKFETMTQNIVSSKMFDEENRFLIIFSFAYSFNERTTKYGKYFIWGTEMEEGFKNILEATNDRIERTTKVFKLLGDRTRYEVLKMIADGKTSVKNIAKQLGVTSATISYHMNSFTTSKVIIAGEGRGMKHVVNFEMLNKIWEDFLKDLKQ